MSNVVTFPLEKRKQQIILEEEIKLFEQQELLIDFYDESFEFLHVMRMGIEALPDSEEKEYAWNHCHQLIKFFMRELYKIKQE